MTRPVLVLTHAPQEGPGLIAPALDHPMTIRTVLHDAHPKLPAPSELAGLVVMGGPMDADDDRHFPGLAAERRLLAEATAAGVPVLGVCLGAQLLGLALGAHLLRRAGTEVGFGPVDVLTDDPLLAPLGTTPTVLHWHQDQVSLPPGATTIASSQVTPVQGFRHGSAVGLQFHLEVDRTLLDLWLDTPDSLTEPDLVDRIRQDSRSVLPALTQAATAALSVFAAQVHARG